MSERLTMRKIREVLRLADECGRSQREIASSLSVAVGTVCGHLKRARAAGLTWERVQSLTDSEVESSLYRDDGRNKAARRAPIDYAHVHHELHKVSVRSCPFLTAAVTSRKTSARWAAGHQVGRSSRTRRKTLAASFS